MRHHCVAPNGVPNGWMTSFPARHHARNLLSSRNLPAQSLLETDAPPLQFSRHEPAPSHSATMRLNRELFSLVAAPDSCPATRQRVSETRAASRRTSSPRYSRAALVSGEVTFPFEPFMWKQAGKLSPVSPRLPSLALSPPWLGQKKLCCSRTDHDKLDLVLCLGNLLDISNRSEDRVS